MSNTIIITIGGNNTIIVSNSSPSFNIIVANAISQQTITIEVPGPPGATGPAGTNVADIYVDYAGLVSSSEATNPLGILVTHPITLNAANSLAIASTSTTLDTTFVLKKNGTQIGSVFFSSGSNTGVITLSNTSLVRSDVFEIYTPSIPDGTLANIKITIAGTR